MFVLTFLAKKFYTVFAKNLSKIWGPFEVGKRGVHFLCETFKRKMMLKFSGGNKGKNIAIAPWFRLHLPSCGPGFESQTLYLRFFQFVIDKRKRGWDWPKI